MRKLEVILVFFLNVQKRGGIIQNVSDYKIVFLQFMIFIESRSEISGVFFKCVGEGWRRSVGPIV